MKKVLLASLAVGFLVSCGSSNFSKKPTIQARSAEAGEAGAVAGFQALVGKADNVDGDNAGDILAKLILSSQFELMKVNRTSSSMSKGGEEGHCVALSAKTEIDEDLVSSKTELSKKGRVIYSKSSNMKASECQAFFQEEIPSLISSDFFDIHISFYSLSF